MTIAAIMQPTYLPWIGYLAMVDRVDRFVLLDDVQFDRRSWQQRNRIKTANGPSMLTIPVRSKSRRDQLINEVEIDDSRDFAATHIRSLEHAYAKAPYFDRLAPGLFEILRTPTTRLGDLTIAVTDWLLRQFGIDTEWVRASELGAEGTKDARLCDICQRLGADSYLSPPGSRNYLDGSAAFREAGIAIAYHDYEHPAYDQINGVFEPFMASVDLLFNCGGQDGRAILRAGVA